MKYKITHTTTYEYHETVPVCQNETRLTPRNHPGQTCRYHRLVVRPLPATASRREDYFGNPVSYFAIHESHRRLSVTSLSKVELHPVALPDPARTLPWELVRDELRRDRSATGLGNYQFRFESPHVAGSPVLADYALESFTPGRPILEALVDLTARIYREFIYDQTATEIHTTVDQIFQMRRGVCQDLAHVGIACLRSLGLAARYVSGYLRTCPRPSGPRLVGADASHAWLSLYCGPDGWMDADPTNNVLPALEHITVAWGRDYSDVCPISGMFVGGGHHTMSVVVQVVPLNGKSADSPHPAP